MLSTAGGGEEGLALVYSQAWMDMPGNRQFNVVSGDGDPKLKFQCSACQNAMYGLGVDSWKVSM
eukprot:2976359-Karenia_brevis.AAC.1